MKNKIQIYLSDLSYVSELSNERSALPLPVGVGYITMFIEKMFPGQFDIKIFKDPNALWDALQENWPDMAGFSSYTWNHNLSHEFIKYMKSQNPETITFMGGPNFTSTDPKWVKPYMKSKPWLDFYLLGEGEYSIQFFLKAVLRQGLNLKEIKREGVPASVMIHPDSGEVILNDCVSLKAQMDNVNDIPSPFLSGILDEYLKDPRYSPIMETNRGCPFSCAFCNWGNATKSKVRQFDLERLRDELHYIGKHNTSYSGFLYIADANFGMLKRDRELAKIIRDVADQYGFPKNIFLYFSKNSSRSVIDIAETLKDLIEGVSLSFQSLNPDTLEKINRKNIHLENYFELCEYSLSKGMQPYTELIYPLPGETYESFTKGVNELLDRGIAYLNLIPLRLDFGTELSTSFKKEEFGLETKFRALTQAYGSFGNGTINAIEYEDVCVKTHTMELEDYIKIRFLHAFLFLFGHVYIYNDLVEYLKRESFPLSKLLTRVPNEIQNMSPVCQWVFEEFKKDSIDELLEKQPESWSPKDIEEISQRKIALNFLNLMRILYTDEAFSSFNKFFLQILIEEMEAGPETVDELKFIFFMIEQKMFDYRQSQLEKTCEIGYDYLGWKNDREHGPLSGFKTESKIKIKFEKKKDLLIRFEAFQPENQDMIERMYFFQRANFHDPSLIFFDQVNYLKTQRLAVK